jgi:hypothetical protein
VAGLDGKEFGGRSLNVNEARPRPDRTGPPQRQRWRARTR